MKALKSSLFYAQKDVSHMIEMLKIAKTYKDHVGGLPEGVVSIITSCEQDLNFLQNRLKNAEVRVGLELGEFE